MEQPDELVKCHSCGKTPEETPMMRRGPHGPHTLCNACGLRWAKVQDGAKKRRRAASSGGMQDMPCGRATRTGTSFEVEPSMEFQSSARPMPTNTVASASAAQWGSTEPVGSWWGDQAVTRATRPGAAPGPYVARGHTAGVLQATLSPAAEWGPPAGAAVAQGGRQEAGAEHLLQEALDLLLTPQPEEAEQQLPLPPLLPPLLPSPQPLAELPPPQHGYSQPPPKLEAAVGLFGSVPVQLMQLEAVAGLPGAPSGLQLAQQEQDQSLPMQAQPMGRLASKESLQGSSPDLEQPFSKFIGQEATMGPWQLPHFDLAGLIQPQLPGAAGSQHSAPFEPLLQQPGVQQQQQPGGRQSRGVVGSRAKARHADMQRRMQGWQQQQEHEGAASREGACSPFSFPAVIQPQAHHSLFAPRAVTTGGGAWAPGSPAAAASARAGASHRLWEAVAAPSLASSAIGILEQQVAWLEHLYWKATGGGLVYGPPEQLSPVAVHQGGVPESQWAGLLQLQPPPSAGLMQLPQLAGTVSTQALPSSPGAWEMELGSGAGDPPVAGQQQGLLGPQVEPSAWPVAGQLGAQQAGNYADVSIDQFFQPQPQLTEVLQQEQLQPSRPQSSFEQQLALWEADLVEACTPGTAAAPYRSPCPHVGSTGGQTPTPGQAPRSPPPPRDGAGLGAEGEGLEPQGSAVLSQQLQVTAPEGEPQLQAAQCQQAPQQPMSKMEVLLKVSSLDSNACPD